MSIYSLLYAGQSVVTLLRIKSRISPWTLKVFNDHVMLLDSKPTVLKRIIQNSIFKMALILTFTINLR